jgi:hypothetical protein
MDNRTPEDDNYATPIGDDLIMMKIKTSRCPHCAFGCHLGAL